MPGVHVAGSPLKLKVLADEGDVMGTGCLSLSDVTEKQVCVWVPVFVFYLCSFINSGGYLILFAPVSFGRPRGSSLCSYFPEDSCMHPSGPATDMQMILTRVRVSLLQPLFCFNGYLGYQPVGIHALA